jgi:hypothetical protein
MSQMAIDASTKQPFSVAGDSTARSMYTMLKRNGEWSGTTGATPITTTSVIPVKAAAGAGVRNYLGSLYIGNAHASVSTAITILDGASIIGVCWVKASADPVMLYFDPPLRSSANAALNMQCATTGASVHVTATGWTGA